MSEIQNLESVIGASSPALVVYDFGGTLLEFERIHVAGFSSVIAGAPAGQDGIVDLPILVRGMLKHGLDSVAMTARILSYYGMAGDAERIATEKRRWVERHLKTVHLSPAVAAHLGNVMSVTDVCVVTQGRADSAREVIARSLRVDPPLVFGRSTESDNVCKTVLLQTAMREMKVEGRPRSALFVGDSTADAEAASAVGTQFMHVEALWSRRVPCQSEGDSHAPEPVHEATKEDTGLHAARIRS